MENLFNSNGVWILEDKNHEGLSIRQEPDGSYWIQGWAEIWDDTWGWTAEITQDELESIEGDPSNARRILQTHRTWYVDPPSSVPKNSYIKTGKLSSDDGFEDMGTGGKW